MTILSSAAVSRARARSRSTKSLRRGRITRWLLSSATVVLNCNPFGSAADPTIDLDRGRRYRVPTFTAGELSASSSLDDDRFRDALTSVGIVALRIENDDDDEDATSYLNDLSPLCDCDLAGLPNGDRAVLDSGATVRSTLAASASGANRPSPPLPRGMDDACGGKGVRDRAERARAAARRAASSVFLPALDRLLATGRRRRRDDDDDDDAGRTLLRTSANETYDDATSVVEDDRAVRLEHFHVYRRDATNAAAGLDWHEDAGLFLVFLPGRSCGPSNAGEETEDSSFWVSVPGAGARVAVFPSPSSPRETVVAVMLGVGAERWLDTPVPLRATRHAVRMRDGETRAWYGAMYLVPPNAVVQTFPREVTFAQMRDSVVSARDDDRVAVGCGDGASLTVVETHGTASKRRRRLKHGVDPSECGDDAGARLYCWMRCAAVVDSSGSSTRTHLGAGESVYCLNKKVLTDTRGDVGAAVDACTDQRGVVGGVMSAGCVNAWHPRADGVKTYLKEVEAKTAETKKDDPNENFKVDDEEEKYCYGATVMHMRGFEWEGTTCVVYLFKSWIITTRAGLSFACLATMLFGVVVELFMRYRRDVVSDLHRVARTPARRIAWTASLHAVQLLSGYLLMLVVMTYSAPLVLCVVLGLSTGHAALTYRDEVPALSDGGGGGADATSGVSDEQRSPSRKDDDDDGDGTAASATKADGVAVEVDDSSSTGDCCRSSP